jgi:hypothetical protein
MTWKLRGIRRSWVMRPAIRMFQAIIAIASAK